MLKGRNKNHHPKAGVIEVNPGVHNTDNHILTGEAVVQPPGPLKPRNAGVLTVSKGQPLILENGHHIWMITYRANFLGSQCDSKSVESMLIRVNQELKSGGRNHRPLFILELSDIGLGTGTLRL